MILFTLHPDMRYQRRFIDIFLLVAISFALDQSTKWVILNEVMRPPRTIELTGFLNLVLGFNTGVSFGLFDSVLAERQALLAGLKLAIVASLVVLAWYSDSVAERAGFSLIVGGALGNVFDRWRQGGVTDFIDFHWSGWHWPAFNMADVAITTGVGFVFLAAVRSTRAARRFRGVR